MNAALDASTLNSIIGEPSLFAPKKGDRRKTVVGIVKGAALGYSGTLFLKRFNYRSFPDFLYKRFFGSRARRLWKISHALRERGLPVPEPIAYLEPTLKCRESFFICSGIEDSDNLALFFRQGRVHDPALMGREVASLLARFHNAGAVHGDMKWHNMLVKNAGGAREYFFVDLDQSKVHKKIRLNGIKKDLTRFYRCGLEMNAKEWVENDFFSLYMSLIDPSIRGRLDLSSIRESARRQWRKKKKIPAVHN